jgi:histone deacetylase complex regulatory component SIN3
MCGLLQCILICRSAGGGGETKKNVNTTEAPPSVDDAMFFVQAVKEEFKDRHPDKYGLFLRIMDDFKNQRIGIAEVTSSAMALFRDTPALALGFNTFLPTGHKINVQLDDLAAYLVRDMSLNDDQYARGG